MATADNRFYIALGIDVLTNIVTTTAQFGDPKVTVVAPFLAGDLVYSGAVKDYIDNEFGGAQGLTDEFARDVVGKTIVTAAVQWITSLFVNTDIGLIDSVLNSLISYTASDGVQSLLDLE